MFSSDEPRPTRSPLAWRARARARQSRAGALRRARHRRRDHRRRHRARRRAARTLRRAASSATISRAARRAGRRGSSTAACATSSTAASTWCSKSSRERRILLRIAPHLVTPLRFTWPVYRGARIPRWKLRAGLTLYDVLAVFRNVGRHRMLSACRCSRRGAVLCAGRPARRRHLLRRRHRRRAAHARQRARRRRQRRGRAQPRRRRVAHRGSAAAVRGARLRIAFTRTSSCARAARSCERHRPVDATRCSGWPTRRPSAGVLGTKGVHIAVPRSASATAQRRHHARARATGA